MQIIFRSSGKTELIKLKMMLTWKDGTFGLLELVQVEIKRRQILIRKSPQHNYIRRGEGGWEEAAGMMLLLVMITLWLSYMIGLKELALQRAVSWITYIDWCRRWVYLLSTTTIIIYIIIFIIVLIFKLKRRRP